MIYAFYHLHTPASWRGKSPNQCDSKPIPKQASKNEK